MDNALVAMSVVVVACALLAWIASQTRQPIIAGYFLCGVLLGPVGFSVVPHVQVLHEISHLGVILLLFLAGMVLHPDRLQKFFKTAMVITLVGSALTWIMVFGFLRAWGFGSKDATIAAVALMFSSTILVVKLLPTTTLHQKYMGSICIAVLIAQDLLAVIALLFVGPDAQGGMALVLLPLKVIGLIVVAVLGEQFVVRKMMRRADRYNEVLVMLCLGWCVGLAMLGATVGIPHEVGAFLAGVAMARGKIALVLFEELKPLRDFFLMFFFFVLGATLELQYLGSVWLPATLIAVLIVATRPACLGFLFRRMGEEPAFARETGYRLGQASEFALVIAVAAAGSGHLSARVGQLVQLATVLTMLLSSYLVVMKFPTPIGVSPRLLRD